MERASLDVLVVGGGVFGTSAALELARRGHHVKLLEAGRVPHPRASSTDISKLVRIDYGADVFYTELAERALTGWRHWSRAGVGAPGAEGPERGRGRSTAPGGRTAAKPGSGEASPTDPHSASRLFHETGLLVLAGEPMRPGGFEHDSWALLTARGHPLERIGGPDVPSRFPRWRPGRYPDGYLNPAGGWVESGRLVAALGARAAAEGVELLQHTSFVGLLERGSRVGGVRTASGEELPAERVLMCAGAWTSVLLPWLASAMWPTAQPVLHFRPDRPERWRGAGFPPWCADIARTGWYGFPLHPAGVVKVGRHGTGWRIDPEGFTSASGTRSALPTGTEDLFRDFLSGSLPELADAPLAEARVCLYCDTFDGNFWIGADPEREGLFVAAGGSGHGFKFAPVLGPLIADLVEGEERPEVARLGWRRPGAPRTEQARAR